MDGERWERLGLQALATLPLWVAGALVAVFARDLAEVASAVVAGAGLISLCGLVALLALSRRMNQAGERQQEVVAQSLALVDCMKEINRRVASMESVQGCMTDETGTALAIVSTLSLPKAGNDPDPAPLRRQDIDPGIVRTRVLRLSDQSCVSTVLHLATGVVSDENDVQKLLDAVAREPSEVAVEIAVPLKLLCSPVCSDAFMQTLAKGTPPLLLAVEQGSLRSASREEARALTRLTRLGLRLSLTGLSGIDAGAEALRACAVAHVRMGRQPLLDAARDNPQRLMRWSDDLARQGIRLAVDSVQDARDAAIFAAFGIPMGIACEKTDVPEAAVAGLPA